LNLGGGTAHETSKGGMVAARRGDVRRWCPGVALRGQVSEGGGWQPEGAVHRPVVA
jgi:hypothetical protein